MHCDLDLWPFDLKIYRAHPCLMGSLHVKFHDDKCKGKAVMHRKPFLVIYALWPWPLTFLTSKSIGHIYIISMTQPRYTPRNEVRGGILESPCPSVCPSVCPAAFGIPAHNCFPFTKIQFIYSTFQSITSGTVPSDWEHANVWKGDKHNAINYRPVSLTCILCKLCEQIIFSNLMQHLEHTPYFKTYSKGFVPPDHVRHSWHPLCNYANPVTKIYRQMSLWWTLPRPLTKSLTNDFCINLVIMVSAMTLSSGYRTSYLLGSRLCSLRVHMLTKSQ